MQLNTAHFSDDIPSIFELDGDLDLAVAFVTEAGLVLVSPSLERKLESGRRIRLLLDLQEGATDPTALWRLVTLARTYTTPLLLKAYVPNQGILHSKVYINETSGNVTLVTGSANLSAAALTENVEHGLSVLGTTADAVIEEAREEFEQLWNSEYAFDIDDEAVRLYETYCGLRRASLTRAQRRAKGSWRDLVKHFKEGPARSFEWPSVGAAFIIGAITARGYFHLDSSLISIRLLFKASAYKDGRITVREASFDATTVLPEIPQLIAAHAGQVFPRANVSIENMRVTIDFQGDLDTFGTIVGLFVPQMDCNSFHLPNLLANAEDSVVAEFIRGFAVASALLTNGTSMPGNALTRLPGQMVVWLRPKQHNLTLYDQLDVILSRRLHITVYHHRRSDRDPHLKLLCDEFAEIGFGIDWWDQLLQAGAEYNHALFPQERLPNL